MQNHTWEMIPGSIQMLEVYYHLGREHHATGSSIYRLAVLRKTVLNNFSSHGGPGVGQGRVSVFCNAQLPWNNRKMLNSRGSIYGL